jgi:hypothetical protein
MPYPRKADLWGETLARGNEAAVYLLPRINNEHSQRRIREIRKCCSGVNLSMVGKPRLRDDARVQKAPR